MKYEHVINSIEDLRKVIEEPAPFVAKKVLAAIDGYCKDFIAKSPFICVGTSDSKYRQDVSPKGDAPGFVKVLDETTLLIPDRPGNHLAFGFKNIIETKRIGLIFLVPGVKETLRVNGEATISKDPELLKTLSVDGKPALLCTIVDVKECFIHCGKAFIRSKLWQTDTWANSDDGNINSHLAKVMDMDEEFVATILKEDYANNLY
jgi:uncharacterized protein